MRKVILLIALTIGGFAGDSIVEPKNRLKSFDGKEVCVSANWMSAPTIDYLLASKQIKERVAVSKNVCHGVGWFLHYFQLMSSLQ